MKKPSAEDLFQETRKGLRALSERESAGFCGAGSYFFSVALRHYGYRNTFVLGDSKDGTKTHCWVEKGAYLFDITADQFKGGDPRWITKKVYSLHYSYYPCIDRGKDAERRLKFWFINPTAMLPTVRDYVKSLKKGTLHYRVWSSILDSTEKFARRAASQ